MATQKIPPPVIYLHVGETRTKVTLMKGKPGERDIDIPRVFSAQFELPTVGSVELEVAAEDGRVRVRDLRIVEQADEGIDGVTLAGVAVGRLLVEATTRMARISGGGGLIASRTAATKAARRRVSDERLKAVAVTFQEGGISAVLAAENVAERQAWRLKAEAKKLGYLKGDDDGER